VLAIDFALVNGMMTPEAFKTGWETAHAAARHDAQHHLTTQRRKTERIPMMMVRWTFRRSLRSYLPRINGEG
jgi:hypothetical protein